MDAVGPTSLVLQCVEGLNAAIRNIQGAPEQVQNLQNDLGALSPVLKQLDQESRNASSGVVMTNEMKNVLDNTGNACQNFQDSLAHWTRHSTAEKIRIFDRLSIGLLKQEQITSLKGVLDGCKSTLTVTLSTAIYLKLSRRDLETKEKTRLLQEHKTQIEQQLVNVNAHTAELEQRAGKIATMQEEQVGERDKVLEELRQQREINDTLRKTCQEALQRTDHELPAQYFGNIKTTNNSASFAGSIDNPGGQNIKLQRFSAIETDGRSISAAGVVNGVDFAALATAMRKSG